MTHVTVKLRDFDPLEMEQIASSHGITLQRTTPALRLGLFSVPDGTDTAALLAALSPDVNPGIERVNTVADSKPVSHATPLAGTNDPHMDVAWHLKRINWYRARKILADEGIDLNASDVTIAILDSSLFGVLGAHGYHHPDLDPALTQPVETSAFTVDSEGAAPIKHAPDDTAGHPITVVMSDTTTRTRVYVGPVAAGQFMVLTKTITDGVGYGTGTVSEACPSLVFHTSDAGMTGSCTYTDRRLANMGTWSSDPADFCVYDEYDPPNSYNTTVVFHASGPIGIVGAAGNNASGSSGIVPGCRLLFVSWEGSSAAFGYDLAASIVWAVDHGADVISMSISLAYTPATEAETTDGGIIAYLEATAYAAAHGCSIVIAASNENNYWDDSTPFDLTNPVGQFCGKTPHSIAVGALAQNDARWTFYGGAPPVTSRLAAGHSEQGSNYGPNVRVVTPAMSQPTCWIQFLSWYSIDSSLTSYGWFGYTSGATPVAAAILYAIRAANPALTQAEAEAIFLGPCCDASYSDNIVLSGPGATTIEPFSRPFPNGGIPNLAKGVLASIATRADKAGRIFPYANFFKLPPFNNHDQRYGVTGIPTAWDLFWKLDFAGVDQTNIGTGPHSLINIDSSGNATTTLAGPIAIEVRGFSSDAITSVELWLGGTQLYSGAPAILNATATAVAGTYQSLKVVAHTAGGSSEQVYDDVLVSTITNITSSTAPGAWIESLTEGVSFSERATDLYSAFASRLKFGPFSCAPRASNTAAYFSAPVRVSNGTVYS